MAINDPRSFLLISIGLLLHSRSQYLARPLPNLTNPNSEQPIREASFPRFFIPINAANMGTTATTLAVAFSAILIVCLTAGVVTCWRMSAQKKQDARREGQRGDNEAMESAHRRAQTSGTAMIPMIETTAPTPPLPHRWV